LVFILSIIPDCYRLSRVWKHVLIMKWSWLSDFLGYYLLLVPAAFLLHYWLKKRNPYWMGIFTFCGLTYIFCGSIGAVILAKIWPTLITGYTNSSGVTKEIYGIVFTNSTGLWRYLELSGIPACRNLVDWSRLYPEAGE